jgi:hypothetical protein
VGIPAAEQTTSHSRNTDTFSVLAYSALKSSLYPVERCVDFNTNPDAYIAWLYEDKAYLHSVLLGTSAMKDYMALRPLSKATLSHLRRAITSLNDRLTAHDAYKSDAIWWCVLTLATLSAMFSDKAAGAAHMKGLRRIVELRGGKRYVRADPKKHFKLTW